MALLASDILTRVRTELIDTGSIQRWSDTELLQWLSDAQRTIVVAQPSACNTIDILPLSAGTRQALPADAYMLLSVIRNVSADGAVPLRAVRVTTLESLDTLDANWAGQFATSLVQNYVYDPNDQLNFMVYPPNDGTGHLLINYAAMPVEVTATNQALSVLPIYRPALFDYVMYRAHMKDSDYAAGQTAATIYMQSFSAFIGVQGPAQDRDTPGPQGRATQPHPSQAPSQ